MTDLYSFGTPFGGVNVARRASEDFQGLIEELEKAGAPLGKIGSYNYRNIAGTNTLSEHGKGLAIDVGNQRGRNLVDPAFKSWVEENPERYSSILSKYNMRGGETFRNPDLGHIEWLGDKGSSDPQLREAAPLGGAVPSNYDTEDRTAAGIGLVPKTEDVATGPTRMANDGPQGILGALGMQNQQPQGLLGALGDPETMAYIGMMLKGFSPYSNIDPNSMLSSAHTNALRRQALMQQQAEQATDNTRADRALNLREQEYGLSRQEREDRNKGIQADREERTRLLREERERQEKEREQQRDTIGKVYGGLGTNPGVEQIDQALANPYLPKDVRDDLEKRRTRMTTEDKDKAIPAELAGRLGMTDVYLGKADKIGTAIDKGDLTGPMDLPLAKYGQGKSAEIYRDMQSGADALTRMMTGAGMPASEAEAYAQRYLPAWNDSAASLRSKHDRLVQELKTIKATVEKGRVKSPGASPSGASATGDTKAPDFTQVKKAPDGKYYVPDPNRPGKYLEVQP